MITPKIRKFLTGIVLVWLASGILIAIGYMWAWGFIVPKWIPDTGYWCSAPYSPVSPCDVALYNGKILVGLVPIVFLPAHVLFRLVKGPAEFPYVGFRILAGLSACLLICGSLMLIYVMYGEWGLIPSQLWPNGVWCSNHAATSPTGCDLSIYYLKIATTAGLFSAFPIYFLGRVLKGRV